MLFLEPAQKDWEIPYKEQSALKSFIFSK